MPLADRLRSPAKSARGEDCLLSKEEMSSEISDTLPGWSLCLPGRNRWLTLCCLFC